MPQNLLATLALTVTAGVCAPLSLPAQEASPEAGYRQQLMQGLRLHTGAMRAVLGGAAPAGHVRHHAVAVQSLATALANAFPEGSGGPATRALPAIWQNRMDFMNKVSAIQTAAASLVEAAEGGDSDAISEGMSAVQGSCQGCHQPYRGPAR